MCSEGSGTMTRQARAVALLCSAILVLLGRSDVGASPMEQTQAIDLTSTNFGTTSSALSGQDPLVFKQFDTQGGKQVLDAVDLIFHGKLTDDYSMTFVTPATISVTVGSGDPLTPGPVVSLFRPDGTTLATVHTPDDPSYWTRTKTYGFNPGEGLTQTFNSNFSTNSPFYLAPAAGEKTEHLKLTSPSDLGCSPARGPWGCPSRRPLSRSSSRPRATAWGRSRRRPWPA